MNCPNCGGRSIGRGGTAQYYCGARCIECSRGRGGRRVNHLNADGELIAAAAASADAPAELGQSPP